MVSIPIWLLVALVTLSAPMALTLLITLITWAFSIIDSIHEGRNRHEKSE